MSLITLSMKHGQTQDEARNRLEPAVNEVRKLFGALIQHVVWSRPHAGSQRRRGVAQKGHNQDPRCHHPGGVSGRHHQHRQALSSVQSEKAASCFDLRIGQSWGGIQFMPGIAATLSSWSGGCGGGREAAASAWYSSLPVPELPRQTCGLAAAGLAVLLARHQWQEASC